MLDIALLLHVMMTLIVDVCYGRYHITPARELQFGAMTLNSRKSRTFTIENLSNKFEFKFNISATPTDMVVAPVVPAPPTKEDKKKSVDCICSLKSLIAILCVPLIISCLARNTFCGTWYLPHSQFHNE